MAKRKRANPPRLLPPARKTPPPKRVNKHLVEYHEAEVMGKKCRSRNGNPYHKAPLYLLEELGERYQIAGFNKSVVSLTKDEIEDHKRYLADHINAAYICEHPYLDWSVSDLRNFVSQRGLQTSQSGPLKSDLITLLEAADAQQTFPFMKLPPELRLHVYKFAFLQRQTTRLDRSRSPLLGDPTLQKYRDGGCVESAYGHGEGPLGEHALTRTSWLLRTESLPVFYNTRRSPLLSRVHSADMPDWYVSMPPKNINSIRRFMDEENQWTGTGVFVDLIDEDITDAWVSAAPKVGRCCDAPREDGLCCPVISPAALETMRKQFTLEFISSCFRSLALLKMILDLQAGRKARSTRSFIISVD